MRCNQTLTLILPAVNSLPQINSDNTQMISFALHNSSIYHISIYLLSRLCLLKSYAHTPSAEIKPRKLTKGWVRPRLRAKPNYQVELFIPFHPFLLSNNFKIVIQLLVSIRTFAYVLLH